jgi:prophage regulatory protein
MNKTSIRMLRLPQVIDATGLGKTKIYELQGRGDFPMRIKITAHSVAWVEEEVQAWLAARIEQARSETAAPGTQRPLAARRRER